MKPTLKAEINRTLALFEPYLHSITLWETWPTRLANAARYSLFGGGKRVRPCLALLTAEALGGRMKDALPWAAAVEMIHTYSLIHDDLPAMDDDDVRRGQPTCHRKFDEATAILAGDALLTEAFAVVGRNAPDRTYAQDWVRLLAEASGGMGMVGGQVEDLQGVDSLDSLISMQGKKTGALIETAVVGGGITAGIAPEWMRRLTQYGQAVGILFQITDDLLDAQQDAERNANSFLHHMSLDAVYQKRDEWFEKALLSIQPLDHKGDTLRYFVEYVRDRQV